MYESVTLLAAWAARTRRIRLGVACMASLAFRHPLLVAQQLANLDTLSDGRLTLIACPGWASGELVEKELATFNVSYPAEVATAGGERRLPPRRQPARPGPVTFADERLSVSNLTLEPQFVQQPLPIWAAANPAPDASKETVQRPLGRFARLGDGWMTYAVNPAQLREQVAILHELRDELGAPNPEDSVYLQANVAHDESAAVNDALSARREVSTRNVSVPELQEISAIDAPARCVDFIAELVDAGATSIALYAVSADRERQLDLLSSSLLPLRRALSQPYLGETHVINRNPQSSAWIPYPWSRRPNSPSGCASRERLHALAIAARSWQASDGSIRVRRARCGQPRSSRSPTARTCSTWARSTSSSY